MTKVLPVPLLVLPPAWCGIPVPFPAGAGGQLAQGSPDLVLSLPYWETWPR